MGYTYFSPYNTLEDGLVAHEKAKRHLHLMKNLLAIIEEKGGGLKAAGTKKNQDAKDEIRDSEKEVEDSKKWLLEEFKNASPEMQGKILAMVLDGKVEDR